jgi:5,10-methylenetetrahydromethanopterin reductase
VRIGVGVGGRDVTRARAHVKTAADDGFASAWFNHIFGLDALTACAVTGAETPIDVGTYVTPVQPRHPTALAQQAATTHDACNGRLTLGIGLSHRIVVENMWGLDFGKQASYMREYLSVLMPLLDVGSVSFEGEIFRVNAMIERPRDDRPSVVVAALGPKMLALAGELADGTATWMTGPNTLAEHTVPSIQAAAKAAGRPAPRILAALPVCVTTDLDRAREEATKQFGHYGTLPSYRNMLDKEGAAEPADLAIVGDEDAVVAGIRTVADAGVTEFVSGVFGSDEEVRRTRELLTGLDL